MVSGPATITVLRMVMMGLGPRRPALFAFGDEKLLSRYRATGPQAGKYR